MSFLVMAAPDYYVEPLAALAGVAALAVALAAYALLLRLVAAQRRRQASAEERAATVAERRWQALRAHGSEAIAVMAPDATLLRLIPPTERLWGYPAGALRGVSLLSIVHEADRAAVRALLERVAAGTSAGERDAIEARLLRADGEWRTSEIVLADATGEPGIEGIVLNGRDIAGHAESAEQARRQSLHDPLTHLPGRGLLLERAASAVARAGRDQPPAALLLCDIDNFRLVNDGLGHAAGDALLRSVAARLTACAPPAGALARCGGDEFALLLDDAADSGRAEALAERMGEALRAPMRVQGRAVCVTASIGIAAARDGTDSEALLRDADAAMRQAKAQGPGRYAVFEPSMDRSAAALERFELESELRRALAGDELTLHYQPIICLRTGRVVEVEALARWRHPTRGLIAPAEFIPVAEASGQIMPLGRWVLHEACRQVQSWQARLPAPAPALGVSINISARQLQHGDFVRHVMQALWESRLPAEKLKLEITETAMMEDAAAVIPKLHQLKALGVSLAVDDFGTGYSSLAYLSSLPVDTLKIDRSFVAKMNKQEGGAIINAIVSLAKSLKLNITCEGIETSVQLAQLRALGCDQGQGFYFAAAVDTGEFEALYAALSGGCFSSQEPLARRAA